MSQVLNNPAPLAVESGRRILSRETAVTLAIRLLVVAIALFALCKGLELRAWAWAHSDGVRFNGDVANGYHWGSFVVDQAAKYAGVEKYQVEKAPSDSKHPVALTPFLRGFWSSYDEVRAAALREHHPYLLDYTPLRLLVMAAWVRETRASDPHTIYWTPELTHPLLTFNSVCELASALAVFFLVWHWRGRSARLAWVLALVAALLVWFDPSIILDDHMWPQWDVWLLPFYLWAAFCCSTQRWFTAGVLIALGAMLKGQVLTVAPVFALWAIFDFKPWCAVRLLCGLIFGAALVVAPWMIQNATATHWMIAVCGAIALLAIPFFRRKFDVITVLVCVFAAILLLYPFIQRQWISAVPVFLLATIAIAFPFITPRKWIGVYALSVLAIAVFIAGVKFDGSWSWYEIGFKYPMDHFRTPAAGTVNNLPAIFGVRYGWRLYDPVGSFTLPWSGKVFTITFQLALRLVYFALLTLCAIGLTIQSRRKSPMTLVGFAAPWVIMFAFTPQMHCRYLVWGAAATALCAGVSLGLTLLHVVVTALSVGMLLDTMLNVNPDTSPTLLRVLQGMEPDMGWTIALIALIYLYVVLKPGVSRNEVQRNDE